MNLYRGFKRMTLLLSIVVTLAVWFWFSEGRLRVAEEQQKALEKDAEQYRCFWECWELNDPMSSSRRELVTDLLTGPGELKEVFVWSGDNGRFLYLAPDVVFPGIESLRVHLDTHSFSFPFLRMSDSALDEAAQAAKAKCVALESRFSRNLARSPRKMLTTSIVQGMPVAAGAFGAVWFLFLVLKWTSRGFSGDMTEPGKPLSSGDSIFTSKPK